LPVVATLQNQLHHYVHKFVKFVESIVYNTQMNNRKDVVKFAYIVLKNVVPLLWVHSIEEESWIEELTIGSSCLLKSRCNAKQITLFNDLMGSR
jgi:hypothetical protein